MICTFTKQGFLRVEVAAGTWGFIDTDLPGASNYWANATLRIRTRFVISLKFFHAVFAVTTLTNSAKSVPGILAMVC